MARAVTGYVPAIRRLRSDFQRLNASFATSRAFRFGRGGGFCAEMLGLVKSMMVCLDRRTRLCLSRGGHPTGIGIVEGFTDYFQPIFPVVDAGLFNALNVQAIRGSGRIPLLRSGVSQLLHVVTGSDYFMVDELPAVPARLVVPELGIDAEYQDACALLLRLLWVYRPEIEQEINEALSTWGVPESYLSVHLRRGDKNLESSYVPVDRYVAAIGNARPHGGVVVVASDDASVVGELATLLGSRFQVVPCSAVESRGFSQDKFNRLPAAERFRQVKRFLGELEALRAADLFVGSAGSNVTYLIGMMRAGRNVVQVDPR